MWQRWWHLGRDRGSLVIAVEQGLIWKKKEPPCSPLTAGWYISSSPIRAPSWHTSAAPSAKSQCQLPLLFALFNWEGPRNIFWAWLPVPHLILSISSRHHWITAGFAKGKDEETCLWTSFCGMPLLSESFADLLFWSNLPSLTPLEPHWPPGRQNHIPIPLLHASTGSFVADSFLMRRVGGLS